MIPLKNMPKLLLAIQEPFYPDLRGGSELSTHYLFKQLLRKGWEIEALCLAHPGLWPTQDIEFWDQAPEKLKRSGGKKLSAIEDTSPGYRCLRFNGHFKKMTALLDNRLKNFKPDVVLGHFRSSIPLLKRAANQGFPAFYYAHIVHDLKPGFRFPENIRVIANSSFTAAYVSPMTAGAVQIVLPCMDLHRHKAARRQGRHITFIHNPHAPKGIRLAARIAARTPRERFVFVQGEEKFAAPNITLLPYQERMSQVYRTTRILLVPSQFPDPFARVVLEAQINGIPVVAADTGGLYDTVGGGGLLIRQKRSAAAYAQALQKLRRNPVLYRNLSRQALENSRRPDFDPKQQLDKMVELLQSVC